MSHPQKYENVRQISPASDGGRGSIEELTSAQERQLVRRIDWHLMPVLFLSYALQLMDKTSLAYSAMLGIKTDLHLVGQQYSWVSSIFYIGYLAASYPMSIGFVKFPLAKYLSFLTGAWGVVLVLHALAQNYAGLMVLRVFLGICESALTPGFSLITGMWYTPREQVARHLIWTMGNCFGEVIGSLLSYAILQYAGDFAQWKILFVLFGLITVVWSIFLWFYLPDSADCAHFLSPSERKVASLRPKKFQRTTQTGVWERAQCVEVLRDPKSWWFLVFMFILMVPSGGVTAFSTIIVHSLGFNQEITILLGLAAVPFQLITFAVVGLTTTFVRRARLNSIVGLYLVSLVGVLLVKLLPEDRKWGRVVGFWLVRSYMPMLPLTLTLFSSNTAGFTKKSTTAAMMFIGYCVGNLVGPQFFVASEAPNYQTAYTTWIFCFVLTIALAMGMRAYLNWQNRSRDLVYEI
ncbi:hypothetical protein FE257_010394 [Aspergillus nanangensis]|uniref:Major facilitator superfamily (MFS) profile domain-containing protein n=1 Tax=Aspergillus nanangensis TaxID=2582783 RepID=A0AAD4CIV9_ASPNN|nr:hypothetical protein FE257_010394 [Aspergillus nanangensis]